MFEIWIRAITRPMLATYQELLEEEPNPSLGTALLWMAVYGAILAMGIEILSFVTRLGEHPDMASLLCGPIVVLVTAVTGAVIGFFVGSGIHFVSAKILGGEGTFVRQSYLLAAACAPMSIISVCLVVLPCVGPLLGLVSILYMLWLAVLALQAAHRFTAGRAVASVLAPLVFLGISLCVLGIPLCVIGYRFYVGAI